MKNTHEYDSNTFAQISWCHKSWQQMLFESDFHENPTPQGRKEIDDRINFLYHEATQGCNNRELMFLSSFAYWISQNWYGCNTGAISFLHPSNWLIS